MSLYLENTTSLQISAAIAFRDNSACGGEGGGYHVRGWWNIGPHTRIKVDSRDVGDVGRFWYAHAHSTTTETPPQSHEYACPPQQFDRCWLIWISDGQRRFFTEHVFTTDDAVIRFT